MTDLRDQILGTQRTGGERSTDYRTRSHQALRQAEEIVLAELLDTGRSPRRRPRTTWTQRRRTWR